MAPVQDRAVAGNGLTGDPWRGERVPAGSARARRLLKLLDLLNDCIERGRHQLMCRFRIVAFDKIRFVSVAGEKLRELFVAQAREHRWTRDLVAVQV